MRPAEPGMAVTAVGIDAGDGGAGERLALSGVVLDPREDLAAFGPGLVAWLPGARPGFSGGPLLDERGRLVGMVTAIRPAEGGPGWRPPAAAGGRPAVEAFALRAGEVRAEVRRLLAAGALRGLHRPARSGVRWGRARCARMSVAGFTFSGLPARVIFGDGHARRGRAGDRPAGAAPGAGAGDARASRGGGAAGGGARRRGRRGSSPERRCTRRSR